MMRAYVKTPRHLGDKWQCFAAGLSAIGYKVTNCEFSPDADDLLVIWNRMRRDETVAARFQRAKAKIIIAENGYIGRDSEGTKLFAMSRTYHNGAGKWPEGDAARWAEFDIELKPWREKGETILVLPQRGMGSPGVAMPLHWPDQVISKLHRMTGRSIKIRRHPGQSSLPREPDFSNVFAAVTWGSGAAIKALAAGVPVFYDFPHWIGRTAALPLSGADIEKPFLGDRLPMFERLAWAQWRISEISTGQAFRELVAL